jgi:hypothetical protein
MKLFHDFFNARPRIEVFKNRSDRHPSISKNPSATASVRNAFDSRAFRPIKPRHIMTRLHRSPEKHGPTATDATT